MKRKNNTTSTNLEVTPESASKNLDELTGDDFTFKDRINSYAEVMGPISLVNKNKTRIIMVISTP